MIATGWFFENSLCMRMVGNAEYKNLVHMNKCEKSMSNQKHQSKVTDSISKYELNLFLKWSTGYYLIFVLFQIISDLWFVSEYLSNNGMYVVECQSEPSGKFLLNHLQVSDILN